MAFNNNFGELLMQAAQGIVAQKQAQRQMQLRVEQFKAQQEQQDTNNKLKQQELDTRERTLKVQEEQNQRAAAFQPLKVAGAQLDLVDTQADIDLKAARTKAIGEGKDADGKGRGKLLTDTSKVGISRDLHSRARELGYNQLASQWAENNGEQIEMLGSREAYQQRKKQLDASIAKLEASDAVLVQRAKKLGDPAELQSMVAERDKVTRMLTDPKWREAADDLELNGPDPQIKLQIGRGLYGDEIMSQMDIAEIQHGPPKEDKLDTGTVGKTKMDRGWDMFTEGNVDVLGERVLEASDGKLGKEQATQLLGEVRRRYPEGPERDAAFSNLRKLFEKYRTED